tara:strand:- start:848 stop:991 length:144 start_codon:yes stop_codon:yes gene_type:complete
MARCSTTLTSYMGIDLADALGHSMSQGNAAKAQIVNLKKTADVTLAP